MTNPNRQLALGSLIGALGLMVSLPVAAQDATKPTQADQAQTAPKTNQAKALPTYVRTKVETPVRNFQGRAGLDFIQLPKGTLLQVHSQSLGTYPFYEVSNATGFPVWVFGKYLNPTPVDGVLQVTGNHINQRPRPSTDTSSTPLRTRLMSGDRVQVIKRFDETKSMQDDWVQVWSPERTRAWVEVIHADPVVDKKGALAEWNRNLRALPTTPSVKNASAPKASGAKATPAAQQGSKTVRPEATKSLNYSDHLFNQAITNRDVTLAQLEEVESAYHRVLEMAPAGTTVRGLALQQLEKVKMHKEMAQLRADMRAGDVAKKARIMELAEQQRLEDLKESATWGRFHSRGWVETEKEGGEVHYYVRWDGKRQAELVCGSGRYDLAFFKDYQVGVQGSTRRAATQATIEEAPKLRLIDVSRIEVIAGSSTLR